jgi:hypothetical protein
MKPKKEVFVIIDSLLNFPSFSLTYRTILPHYLSIITTRSFPIPHPSIFRLILTFSITSKFIGKNLYQQLINSNFLISKMVKSWLMADQVEDQRQPSHRSPPVFVELSELAKIGVEYFHVRMGLI